MVVGLCAEGRRPDGRLRAVHAMLLWYDRERGPSRGQLPAVPVCRGTVQVWRLVGELQGCMLDSRRIARALDEQRLILVSRQCCCQLGPCARVGAPDGACDSLEDC